MATSKKILTPVVTLDHPYLIEPDLGNPNGAKAWVNEKPEYKVKAFAQDSEQLQALLRAVMEIAESAYQGALESHQAEANAFKADPKNRNRPFTKRAPERASPPLIETQDGFYFQAKLYATGIRRDNGKPFEQRPRIFNSKNKPWDMDTPIYSGTTARLHVEVYPYATPAKAGASIRLLDVQIIDLVTRGGDDAPNPFGGAPMEEPNPFDADGNVKPSESSGGADYDF